MAARKRKKVYPVVVDSDGVFLDLNNVGSSVHWRVDTDKDGELSASITLRDCNRSITWSHYSSPGDKHERNPETDMDSMTQKLTLAMEQLQKALESYQRQRIMRDARAKA